MQIKMTVLNGLPVTIEASIEGPDYDVGIMGNYVEEWYISEINGRKVKKEPKWLYDRIAKAKGEEDRIIEEIMSYVD